MLVKLQLNAYCNVAVGRYVGLSACFIKAIIRHLELRSLHMDYWTSWCAYIHDDLRWPNGYL